MSRFKGFADVKNRAAEPAEAAAKVTAPDPSPALLKPGKASKKPGKRSDPAFVQVTAYISDELNRKVKAGLIQVRRDRDFSGVVAELLETWVAGLPRTQHGDDAGTRSGK